MSNQESADFNAGQVWQSPRGTFYRVEEVRGKLPAAPGSAEEGYRQAILRVGLRGSGRRIFRDRRRTQGWRFVAPSVTPELIRQAMEGELD